MRRSQSDAILKDLNAKMVLLSGPRQVGKTTLATALTPDHDYLNYDYPEHRLLIAERSWDRKKRLLIFDELHKMRNWKSWLKGISTKAREECNKGSGILTTRLAMLQHS